MKYTKKIEKINEYAKILDQSLKENCSGFLTYYTGQILKLTHKTKTRINTPVMDRKKELELELYKINKWDEFEKNFRFLMKNSPEFKEKANKILSKIIVSNTSSVHNANSEDEHGM